jgi:hypothetical protein
MTTYLCWDPLNYDVEEAARVDAFDAEEAAEEHAEACYHEDPFRGTIDIDVIPLVVRGWKECQESVQHFEVEVDMHPVFSGALKKETKAVP